MSSHTPADGPTAWSRVVVKDHTVAQVIAGSLLGAAAAVLMVLVGVLAWRLNFRPPEPVRAFATAAAEHRVIRLEDGSKVTLGAKTIVDVEFTGNQRRLRLRTGEAFFAVARDPKRPFTVLAGHGAVVALGTQFNIWHDLDRTTVSVAEGVIEVHRATELLEGCDPICRPAGTKVNRGFEISYKEDGATSVVKVSDIEAATAWRDGRLEYRQTPLRYVVSDVNRYFKNQLVIGDPAVGELAFTGAVPQNLTADQFVHALQSTFQVTAIPDHGRIILRTRIIPTANAT